MPIRELIGALDPPAPPEVAEAARSLRYRDFITVALIIDDPEPFPENWIYIHEPGVSVGRNSGSSPSFAVLAQRIEASSGFFYQPVPGVVARSEL
jgi:protoporphyrinogen oxidase